MSPLSRARIRSSAVARFVASGILWMSQSLTTLFTSPSKSEAEGSPAGLNKRRKGEDSEGE